MISFLIATTTPAVLRDFLVARGFAKVEDGQVVGVLPGMEWVEIPSPLAGVRCFMVKVTHQMEADQTDGLEQVNPVELSQKIIWDRTKLGRWIKNNSTGVTVGDGFDARKVNNQSVWLLREDHAERIGVWQ